LQLQGKATLHENMTRHNFSSFLSFSFFWVEVHWKPVCCTLLLKGVVVGSVTYHSKIILWKVELE